MWINNIKIKPDKIAWYWCFISDGVVEKCFINSMGYWSVSGANYYGDMKNVDEDREVLYWWEDEEAPKVTKEIEKFRQGFIKDRYAIKNIMEKINLRKGIK